MQHPGFRISHKERLIYLILAAVCTFAFYLLINRSADAQPLAAGCDTAPCPATYVTRLPMVSFQKATLESHFGIQVYGALDKPAAGLELANQANAGWLRTQISWAAVEPTNSSADQYHFDWYDRSLLSAVHEGIRPIVTVIDNPQWAATYKNGPINPLYLEEFGKFMGAAVERYDGDGVADAPGSPRVRYWEFYNEPDSGDELRAAYGQAYWGSFGKEYAEMLCVAHWYMKAADPTAQIVFGGVAHDWFQDEGGPFVKSFVEDALAAGAGKCFDVFNFHYYPVFASRWDPFGPGIAGKAAYFRTLLTQYGVGDKPLMCTEAGWHSDPDGQLPSSPQLQAEFVVKLFSQAKVARLVANIWWTWMDLGSVVGSYGLLTTGGSPKPAYYAYQIAASRIGTAASAEALTATELGGNMVEGYAFSGSAAPFYVLWSKDSGVRSVPLAATNVRLVNIYGTVITTVTDAQDGVVDGRVDLSVGPTPVYVEILP